MVPNHDIELAKYIDECRDKTVSAWGSHDCLTFAAGCVYAQTGRATLSLISCLAITACTDECALIHCRARRIKKLRIIQTAHVSIIDALDERLDRVGNGPYPQLSGFNHGAEGMITDQDVGHRLDALGVRLAPSFGFPVVETGMIFLDREPADLFWSVG